MPIVTSIPSWENLAPESTPLYAYRSGCYQEAYSILEVKKGDQISLRGSSEVDSGYVAAYGGAILVLFT